VGVGGIPHYIPIWLTSSTLSNSILFQTGGNVGVNTTTAGAKLDVTAGTGISIRGILSGPNGPASAATPPRPPVTAPASYGSDASPHATRVVGVNSARTGGIGVWGQAAATNGNGIGVRRLVYSPSGTAGQFIAVAGKGLILQGLSGSSFPQVFTVDAGGNGTYAGNLNVMGELTKDSGSFKIDRPMDPANKYLSHSFVESPDMVDVHNGVAAFDPKGEAWVNLPDYFEALNCDFRYQLTSIGAPGPNLYVSRGGKPATALRSRAASRAVRSPGRSPVSVTRRTPTPT
jgi:hypothetical protein